MEQRNYFAHRSPDGDGVLERVMSRQYLRGWRDWELGENLGWGQRIEATPAATVTRWLLSAEHRRNMLEPGFKEAGVAVAPGAPLPGMLDDDAAAYVLNLGVRSTPIQARPASSRKRRKKRRRARHRHTVPVASVNAPRTG